jgi:pimeloyl-ACP methyl ester carboxylesterase
MLPESGHIAVGDRQLHYLRRGTGPQLLVAFHGYGNDAHIFDVFTPHLGLRYTLVAIDLPHHGGSEWPADEPLGRAALVTAIQQLMSRMGVEKISLMGYSMGGRICMSLVEDMPSAIDKVALLATDGLAINAYYYFFTRTAPGKWLFARLLHDPSVYFRFADWLLQRKLLHPSRHKFATHYLSSELQRAMLGQVWPSLSQFIPSPQRLKKLVARYNIPVHIFMGEHDKVMPPSLAHKFSAGLSTVKVTVLDKGHRLFDSENAGHIAAYLL